MTSSTTDLASNASFLESKAKLAEQAAADALAKAKAARSDADNAARALAAAQLAEELAQAEELSKQAAAKEAAAERATSEARAARDKANAAFRNTGALPVCPFCGTVNRGPADKGAVLRCSNCDHTFTF
jgi:hypothetical protein